MRVALLTPCFWPEVRRGTERIVRDLADGLLASGDVPRIITSHPARTSRATEDGVEIVRRRRPPGALLERAGFPPHLEHAPLSYRTLRAGSDDVAHAFYVSDAVAAARWTQAKGRPSVYSHMGVPNREDVTWRRGSLRLARHAAKHCSAVTVLSQASAAALRESLGVEAHVMPPGVDVDAFPEGERSPVPTIFCAADPSTPRKRVGLLVEAFASMRREQPDLRLVVARPGDPVAAHRFAAAHPEVELLGGSDPELVRATYAEAWVSVLPSVNEAFGLVLVESLAAGTPVVASDDGGMREIVDNEQVGRLFRGDRPEALARSLREALELAQAPATARACRARAGDFSLQRSVERHRQLYSDLLEAA